LAILFLNLLGLNPKSEVSKVSGNRVLKAKASVSLSRAAESYDEALVELLNAFNLGLPAIKGEFVSVLEAKLETDGWQPEVFPDHSMVLELLVAGSVCGSPRATKLLAEYCSRGLFEPRLPREAAVSIWDESHHLGELNAKGEIGKLFEGHHFHPRDDSAAFSTFRQQLGHLFEKRGVGGVNYPKLAKFAEDDQGFGFGSSIETWKVANIFHQKTIGLADCYSNKLNRKAADGFEKFSQDQQKSLLYLAKASYFGLGFRKDLKTARIILHRMRALSADAFVFLYRDFSERRKIRPELRHAALRILEAECQAHPSNSAHMRLQIGQYKQLASLVNDLDAAYFDNSLVNKGCYLAGKLIFSETLDIHENQSSPLREFFAEQSKDFLSQFLTDEPRLKRFLQFRDALFGHNSLEVETDVCWKRAFHLSSQDAEWLKSELVDNNRFDADCILDFLGVLSAFFAPLCPRRHQRVKNISRRVCLDTKEVGELFDNNTSSIRRWQNNNSKKPNSITILKSTALIGPDHNQRDEIGLPTWKRAKDTRPWLVRNRTNLGWDRVEKISFSPNGFKVLNFVASKRTELPLVFKTDLEVVAILALIEPYFEGQEVEAPSLSLEGFQATDARRFLTKKVFENPSWIRATELGMSMYYSDTLLFIDHLGEGVFSIYDPLVTPIQSEEWAAPSAWIKASNSGGVNRNLGRNAFVVSHQLAGSAAPPVWDKKLRTISIETPTELVRFDGSEFELDKEGNELNPDGGRGWLRNRYVRHADVLTHEFENVKGDFPVFDRVAHLLGLYATWRSAFDGHREEFKDTKLWKHLISRREQYVHKAEQMKLDDQYVLLN
jgi:hypothetical protein